MACHDDIAHCLISVGGRKGFLMLLQGQMYFGTKRALYGQFCGVQSKSEGEVTKIKWIRELLGNLKRMNRGNCNKC